MGTVILIVSLGAALNLALWGAVYHKLHDFPASASKVIERNRAVDETRALDVLQAAAASRLGGLVVGVQTYHEQLAGLARAKVAEAEVRARMTERRASDAAVALDAASALVRDLRTLAEDLPSLMDRRALHTGIAIGEATARREEPDPEERATVEMPPGTSGPGALSKPDRPACASRLRALAVPVEPVDEDRVSGEEELTRVQSHPLPGTQGLPGGGR
jgi:hypothetical protein